MDFSKVLADATRATTLTWNRYARRDAGAYPIPPSGRTALVAGLVAYAGASFLHFAHNAQYLADYPNLPATLTPSRIYLAWLTITAVGVAGSVLYHRGRRHIGLALHAGYAALGFAGLLHYGRASMGAHTAAMNLTIWLEVVAAAFFLSTVVGVTATGRRPRGIQNERPPAPLHS